jgi:amino acid transporter
LRKPKQVFDAENKKAILERSLSLFDLICVGVGGTVGSGVFVLTGIIAHSYAGPGCVISWLIAGICCMLSALSYAELSSRMTSAGSSYAYVYYSLGELPAVIAAWCLSLEYGISGSAVARSWGEQLGR